MDATLILMCLCYLTVLRSYLRDTRGNVGHCLSERSEVTSIVVKLLVLYILDAKDHQNLSVCPLDSEFVASLVFGTCMCDNNAIRIT